MPTRKQRRRREKGRRHEYEYVYVDDDGREVEPPPEAVAAQPKARANDSKGRQRPGARPVRAPRTPNWRRPAAWAIGFGAVLFFVTGTGKHPAAAGSRLFVALAYGVALFAFLT